MCTVLKSRVRIYPEYKILYNISLMELNLHTFDDFFPDEQACLDFLIKQRWPDGNVACLYCGSLSVYTLKKRHGYECRDCTKQFSVRTGMPFEGSAIPLRKWLKALYLLTSRKKGISSVQLAKDLGITQKSAWFMAHRLREGMRLEGKLEGVVAVDETYVGGWRRSSAQRWKNKTAVMGAIETRGKYTRVRVLATRSPNATVALPFIRKNIAKGTVVYTDSSTIYSRLKREYEHGTVNHSKYQWADGDISTNSIEAFWSHLKRGIRGIYLQVSRGHLQRYADEFAFRYNTRHLSDAERFNAWFAQQRTNPTRLNYYKLLLKL